MPDGGDFDDLKPGTAQLKQKINIKGPPGYSQMGKNRENRLPPHQLSAALRIRQPKSKQDAGHEIEQS